MLRVLKLALSAVYHVVTTAASRARRRPQGQCVVLYYHAVSADQRNAFRRQIRELSSRFETVSAGAPELARAGTRSVAVTFDDGFRCVVQHALPVLRAAGVPSVMFVPSGNLGQPPRW